MKKYDCILVDCDGVLADFIGAMIPLFNQETDKNITLNDVVEFGEWESWKVWDITETDFWDIINSDENFWLNIEPYPHADALLNMLKNFGKEIIISTAPSEEETCVVHKRTWLKKHFNIPSSDVMIGEKKYLMAKWGHLLLDDRDKNVIDFKDKGGEGIVLPSSWNSHDFNFYKVINKIHEEIF